MKNRILILLLIAIKLNAQSIQKTMLRLPDTGQKNSYTNTFGEDNDYANNEPFFIKNNDGTTRDTITSLVWQTSDGGEMTIENARIYCDTLTLGGFTDWRLPTPHESFSILNQQNNNPALNTIFFTNTGAEYWWTSFTQSNDATKIWCTNAGGGIGNYPKLETISAGGTKKFHVRAVRDASRPITLPNHFTDNGDGTITDNLTQLIWQKTPISSAQTWEQVLTYAEGLTLALASDWRLPNIKELQSINDETAVNPSLNTTYFNNLGIKNYWASTSLPNQTNKAWYLNTQYGITTYDLKTNSNFVICVRNVKNTSSINLHYNLKENKYCIYPNPFSNRIHIANLNGNELFKLFNSIGQLIKETHDLQCENLTDLPKDIYSLTIIGNSSQSVKIIKE
ncbi:MAG: DUF1566 domain-containing protein [Bacteroidetes bacterium]|nr:DUF1566 domain-containing protein [Bacteroidota bacterium]